VKAWNVFPGVIQKYVVVRAIKNAAATQITVFLWFATNKTRFCSEKELGITTGGKRRIFAIRKL
jgi:hypothetical protein